MQKADDDCCQKRYEKICLVLDDDIEKQECTDTEFGFDGKKDSRFIKWETPKKVARKIYLYFRDNHHANIADLKIVYSPIDTKNQRKINETEPFRKQDCATPSAACQKANEKGYMVAENPWRRIYYKLYEEPRLYKDAKAQCQSDGTYLPVPKSAVENDFISYIVTHCCSGKSHHTWLGIDDIEEDGNHKTVDGSDLTFTNWWENVPWWDGILIQGIPRKYTEPNGRENWMYMYNDQDSEANRAGFWSVKHNWELKFICLETEDFMSEKSVKKPAEYSVAENPWGRSYYKIYLEPTTYRKAQAQCKSDGANLAIPRSKVENDFIAGLIPNKTIWIGINDIENEGNFVTDDGSGWFLTISYSLYFGNTQNLKTSKKIWFSKIGQMVNQITIFTETIMSPLQILVILIPLEMTIF